LKTRAFSPWTASWSPYDLNTRLWNTIWA
jgi:hypothetical protein